MSRKTKANFEQIAIEKEINLCYKNINEEYIRLENKRETVLNEENEAIANEQELLVRQKTPYEIM